MHRAAEAEQLRGRGREEGGEGGGEGVLRSKEKSMAT
jgi:hypothetical protein